MEAIVCIPLLVIVVTAVGLFRILPIPLLKDMMSRIVQPDQQGMLIYHSTLHMLPNLRLAT
jgi:hypothetical protein